MDISETSGDDIMVALTDAHARSLIVYMKAAWRAGFSLGDDLLTSEHCARLRERAAVDLLFEQYPDPPARPGWWHRHYSMAGESVKATVLRYGSAKAGLFSSWLDGVPGRPGKSQKEGQEEKRYKQKDR